VTNQELIQIFLNHCAVERGLAKNSVSAYRRDLDKFNNFLSTQSMTLENIGATTISDFVTHLRATGLGESSIARHVPRNNERG